MFHYRFQVKIIFLAPVEIAINYVYQRGSKTISKKKERKNDIEKALNTLKFRNRHRMKQHFHQQQQLSDAQNYSSPRDNQSASFTFKRPFFFPLILNINTLHTYLAIRM